MQAALIFLLVVLLAVAGLAEAAKQPVGKTPTQKTNAAVLATAEEVVAKLVTGAQTLAQAAGAHAAKFVPEELVPLAGDFLRGAISVAPVGHTLSAAAGGNVPATVRTPLEAAVANTSSKFFFGLGAALGELLLLRLLYSEPYRNRKYNRVNRLLTHPLRWALLVVFLAVPNGVVELGAATVLLLRLSRSVYVPALLVSHLVRPYVVAAVRASPVLAGLYHSYVQQWARVAPAMVEFALCAALASAVVVFGSGKVKPLSPEEVQRRRAAAREEIPTADYDPEEEVLIEASKSTRRSTRK